MPMPCAVQLWLTTGIACHAGNDRPSTRPVRTSRRTCGRPGSATPTPSRLHLADIALEILEVAAPITLGTLLMTNP